MEVKVLLFVFRPDQQIAVMLQKKLHEAFQVKINVFVWSTGALYKYSDVQGEIQSEIFQHIQEIQRGLTTYKTLLYKLTHVAQEAKNTQYNSTHLAERLCFRALQQNYVSNININIIC